MSSTGMIVYAWQPPSALITGTLIMAPADIERQIKRYFVVPGQALSYKIGMLTILELRQSAEDQLGEDFGIREFHDAVLKNGPVPMQVLEEVIDACFRSKRDRIS